MNQQPQSHQWQFWMGLIVLVTGAVLAFAADLLWGQVMCGLTAVAGFVMAIGAVALDAGKNIHDRSHFEKVLTVPGYAPPEEVAQAVARKRRQIADGLGWNWWLIAQVAAFALLVWWQPALWPLWIGVIVSGLAKYWHLWRESKRLDQLENTIAAVKSHSGATT